MRKYSWLPVILGFILIQSPAYSQNFDINLLKSINGNASTAKTNFFKADAQSVQYLNIAAPAGIIIAGLIKHDPKLKKDGLYAAGAYLASSIIAQGLKTAVHRERPFNQYPFIVKRDVGGGYSFPSGHTTTAFTTATSLSLLYPKWYVIVPSYLWAGSVAYARIYQGVHYPTDVLAGAIIGTGTAWLAYKAEQWNNKKHEAKLKAIVLEQQQPGWVNIKKSDSTVVAHGDYYKRPRPFSFITSIPRDIVGYTGHSFQRQNLPKLAIIAGATTVLLFLDQNINNGFQDFARRNNISAQEQFSPVVRVNIGGKQTNIGKLPRNINTAFYDLGQGSSAMFMAAGFFIAGKIKKDYRMLQTASQLTEAFLALGFGTQVLKYATGRENPSDATVRGGAWRPFPSFHDFQSHKPKYDAYPSGHMAVFVSAITIIAENYPEKKWLKPVGYSIAGLCGLAMINNGVHWASDYPLGFALGYGFGKYIANKSRFHLVH